MSDRVNQIIEALRVDVEIVLSYEADSREIEAFHTLKDAARDHAVLLTRLEDGSAYVAVARLGVDWSELSAREQAIEIVRARPVVDTALAALGLQEDVKK